AARLLAGAAVRLLDGDGLPGVRLPFRGEGPVHLLVELARRIIRGVEQRHLVAASSAGLSAGGGSRDSDERSVFGDIVHRVSKVRVSAGRVKPPDQNPTQSSQAMGCREKNMRPSRSGSRGWTVSVVQSSSQTTRPLGPTS